MNAEPGSWEGFLAALPTSYGGLGSTVISPAGFRAEPRPQIHLGHFGPTKSIQNASNGRKCQDAV